VRNHYYLGKEVVARVYPELVVRVAEGKVESVQYQELIPMLLNEGQHQQRELAAFFTSPFQGKLNEKTQGKEY